MFNPFELYVGLRYTRSRRRNQFISFISLTSMAGVALGVAALIVVLSVMNGFEQELRARILGMTAHATITGFDGRLTSWGELRQRALAHPRVEGAAPFIEGEAMLRHGQSVTGGLIRGVVPSLESSVSEIGTHMTAGRLAGLEPGEYGIVLGSALARALGVQPGDGVDVLVPQATVTPAGVMPRMRRFDVIGIFEVGMYEYDRSQAVIHLRDAQSLYRLAEDTVEGLRLRTEDIFAAPMIARDLAERLPGGYFVRDWTERHANFFRAIRTEKTVMFVILALIVAVAAFNIVSTLVMTVIDKQGDIAILRTLGAGPPSIMAIFVVQGALIGIVGTAIGVLLGVSLALNVETVVSAIEGLIGFQFLPADVYYISDLPSELQWRDVSRIALLSLALSLLSTLYPAWRAARTEPAEALRYE